MLRLAFLFAFLQALCLNAQCDSTRILAIEVLGNRKTKTEVILREMSISSEQCTPVCDIGAVLEANRLLLMNTLLFNEVRLNAFYSKDSMSVAIRVQITENAFFVPFPTIELADRNVNVWWREQGASWRRINIAIWATHYNLTGNNDKLKIVGQVGYTQKIELQYLRPAVNFKRTVGFEIGGRFERNKEVAVYSESNRLTFVRERGNYLIKKYSFDLAFFWRPKLFSQHLLRIGFEKIEADAKIVSFQNESLLGRSNFLNDPFIQYTYTFDSRDQKPYPTKGKLIKLLLRKDGIGFSANERKSISMTASGTFYKNVYRKINLEYHLKGQYQYWLGIPNWYHSKALGYSDDYLRGYEYYVVDGNSWLLSKATLRFPLVNHIIKLGKVMPIQGFRNIPLRWYLTAYTDQGVANDPYFALNDQISNRFLFSYGLGIDCVAFYNWLMQAQISRNHLGEMGLFLHYKTSF